MPNRLCKPGTRTQKETWCADPVRALVWAMGIAAHHDSAHIPSVTPTDQTQMTHDRSGDGHTDAY
jgi:hypothetical protein